MLDVATEVTLELARLAREAEEAVRRRIAAEQKGEAFNDHPSELEAIAS